MPIINFKCVREVSSEDSNFTSENLLKQEPGKKWKTKSVGEKSAHCIFELERPMRIIGIDIGNEHSAFVEVLVSNSGCRAEDFKEILITCSFMTPFESKNSTNPNRVRCFNQEAFVPSVADEKWNLIKVICTQPFNKHCQYGLSFIKIHTDEAEKAKQSNKLKVLVPEKYLERKASTDEKPTGEQRPKTFAKFVLREESPDSESESSVALFSRWKKARQSDEGQPTTAAAIRQASTNAGLMKLSQSQRKLPSINTKEHKKSNDDAKSLDRNRNELAFGDDEAVEDEKSQRLSKHIEADKQRLQIQKQDMSKKKEEKDERNTKNHIAKPEKVASGISKKNMPRDINESPSTSRKRRSSPINNLKPQIKKPKSLGTLKYRPFNKLLEGVVLVISGIQNPDRANLRGKALAMGAKYKADWESGCTHLICAFKNTPKYNQVNGKGKIVKRSWIEKCFDLKKYLPWRRYALDSDEQAKPESDDEILDESLKPAEDVISDESDEVQSIKVQRTSSIVSKETADSRDSIEQKPFHIDSGSDTDDYIEDIKKKNNDKENLIPPKIRDIYEVTTEEEDFVKEKRKPTPMFFINLKFFVSKDLKNAIRYQLIECIKNYGGTITSDIEKADYLVTEKISEDEQHYSGEIVNPQWILECNDMEQKVDIKPFLVTK